MESKDWVWKKIKEFLGRKSDLSSIDLIIGKEMKMSIILEAKNISKTYKTGSVEVKALKPCSLTFEKGEFVSIVGKSGSGKSTLLKLLGTTEVPTSGDILLNGNSILNLRDKEVSKLRRRQIGFIYQDYSLLPEFTAYENIIFPIRLDGRKADKQKIEELMEELKKELTIVIVTHNMQQAVRIADKTAFFLLGELVEYGDTDDIFTSPKDGRTERYITGRFG